MKTPSHRFYEDVLALICAGLLVSLGVVMFNPHGVLTGGTAGIALVTSHLTPLSFGLLFFVINLPFYWLAWRQIGRRFTINTFISVSLVSVLSEKLHQVVRFEFIHPVFAAVTGGMLIGVGLLIMFRHKSSLGGLGILAFYLQNRFNVRAGTFQLAVDLSILAFASLVFPLTLVLLSVLGAVTMNILIAVNHKPGRYQIEVATQSDWHKEYLQQDCPLDNGLAKGR